MLTDLSKEGWGFIKTFGPGIYYVHKSGFLTWSFGEILTKEEIDNLDDIVICIYKIKKQTDATRFKM